MKKILPALLALLAFSLAACAPDLEKLPKANFHAYEPDLSNVSEPATIRGSFKDSTGPLGSPYRAVGVFAIDGKVAFDGPAFDTAIPLTPGIHSLTIGYSNGGYGDTIPVVVNAKAGARYVVKESNRTDWLDGLKYDRIRTWLYIEDEKTGEIVVPNTPDVIQSIEARYRQPAGPDVATMRGTEADNFLDYLAVLPIAVDGQIVEETSKQNMWSAAQWEPKRAVALEPGHRAIAIMVRGGAGHRFLPILLEVKPRASYIVKYDHGLKKFGTTRIFTYTIWIEDAVTGEIVMPKADLPGQIYPTL